MTQSEAEHRAIEIFRERIRERAQRKSEIEDEQSSQASPEEDKKVRGLHTRRLSQNPIEKALSDGWAEEIVSVSSINENTLLDGLLELQGRENNRPIGYATDRDHVIAATVVQWLGSPVGFYFLRGALKEAGYEVNKID